MINDNNDKFGCAVFAALIAVIVLSLSYCTASVFSPRPVIQVEGNVKR